ncbi:MAG: FprA family A-type flavoprotein [Eubacterium coprostanoligenes]|uniref:FprA family A-type flavoprotein n=1 Tax=Eubacterium coprostanoligenes TaxID=290054 RepID=UPI002409AD6A|nr:FprA family A-type flavoprotein [Eubacterium coprostanoligenes]MDD6665005.1 FprA family A-type flavoprotein [Eubacterium coprostanoligenes]
MIKISDSVKYIGVNDYDIDLFEGQYKLEKGMAYNSYVIFDEKVAVMDTVDKIAVDRWQEYLSEALGDRKPDYLVVQHLEPDHSFGIQAIADKYPEMKLVMSAVALRMLPQFCDVDPSRVIAVKEGDTLELGSHTLNFVMAPMVHWPEVMVSYESSEKILFSADAFGKFGTVDADEAWNCEARRYYFNIVGKYGKPVQTLLGKAEKLDIQTICPLHGPVLTDTIPEVVDLYKKWSTYEPENEGVFIACASIHGNTWTAAQKLKEILEAKGCPRVAIADLTRDDLAEAVEDGFRHSVLVCMASSYDAGVFTPMEDYLNRLEHKAFQNRTVALVENASWAPSAIKAMKAHFEKMANITLVDKTVTIKTRLTDAYVAELEELADEIMQKF